MNCDIMPAAVKLAVKVVTYHYCSWDLQCNLNSDCHTGSLSSKGKYNLFILQPLKSPGAHVSHHQISANQILTLKCQAEDVDTVGSDTLTMGQKVNT